MQQQRADLYKPSESIKKNIRMSIFEETTMMGMHYKSKNMGQGFPDWETPKFVRDYLIEAVENNENQYTRVAGHPTIVNEIAKTYSPRLQHEIDPLTEITIANGASGILNNAIAALVDKGDEIIFFEPVFEVYITLAEMHGVKPVFCAFNEPREDSDEWTIDFDRLESCFSDKTRMIFLNTPHNPTGKILTKDEIERIIRILDKYPRVIVLTDEVYEHNVFNGNKHISLASFPGMWDRTLSVYSGGKIFSCTGWRVGWGIGPASLVRPLTAYQNWSQFCVSRPTMVSFASALKFSLDQPYEGKNNYYEYLTDLYTRKKDQLRRILSNGPFDYRVLNPDGGYFVIVDITKTIPKIPIKYFYKAENYQTEPVGDYKALENPDYTPDHAFSRWLTIEYGVTPLPMFTFFNQEHAQSVKDYRGSHFVRWTICKSDETINAVAERLTKA